MSNEKEKSSTSQIGVIERTVIGLCFAFGLWWLQNQHQQIENISTQITLLVNQIDDKYVEKEYLILLDAQHKQRFDRLDGKLDKAMNMIREHNMEHRGAR